MSKETSWPELRYNPVINLAVPRLEPVISCIANGIFSASVSLLSSRNEKDNPEAAAAARARIIMTIMIVVLTMLIRTRMAAR